MAMHKLTRIEAAELQLEKSIELFFKKGNPFTIHVLSQNAHEVISKTVGNSSIVCLYKEFFSKLEKDKITETMKKVGYKYKSNKNLNDNVIDFANFFKNKQRNMLKHSKINELNEIIELSDFQNINGIMDALLMFRDYKRANDPSWDFKEGSWFSLYNLFFREIIQYLVDDEKFSTYSTNTLINVFIQ